MQNPNGHVLIDLGNGSNTLASCDPGCIACSATNTGTCSVCG